MGFKKKLAELLGVDRTTLKPESCCEERKMLQEIYHNAFETSEFHEEARDTEITLTEDDIKLIAFYLPQFHTIPENDEWWGKGFTEWTNVVRAVPQYSGHYQPRLPGELGFYNLLDKNVMKRQIELAKRNGVYGFCFHHYWFTGKRLLEKPVDMLLSSEDLDIPFCLCWPNESWSRRWDGSEQVKLIDQIFSPEDDVNFINDLSRYMKDKRYIRIDNRPVVIVYRPVLFPDPKATLSRWREQCRINGVGEIYIIAVQSFGFFQDPRGYGYDASVEFPLHNSNENTRVTDIKLFNLVENGNVNIFDYEKHVVIQSELPYPGYTVYRTVAPSWDNSARRPYAWNAFYNATPDRYLDYLSALIKYTRKFHTKSEQFVFINAWNEWAEGDYIEPDRKYGYAYLNRTAQAVEIDRRNREF